MGSVKAHFDEKTELQMVVWGNQLRFLAKTQNAIHLPTYLIPYSSSQGASDGFFYL